MLMAPLTSSKFGKAVLVWLPLVNPPLQMAHRSAPAPLCLAQTSLASTTIPPTARR